MDYSTRWPEARALKEANALTVSTFIYKEIICRHRYPDFSQTNRGTHFVNELITQLLARFEIRYNERLNEDFEKELFVIFKIDLWFWNQLIRNFDGRKKKNLFSSLRTRNLLREEYCQAPHVTLWINKPWLRLKKFLKFKIVTPSIYYRKIY